MESGALNSSGRVLLRRSSVTRRMLMSGTTSSSTIAALPNNGVATTSVTPYSPFMPSNCDWIAMKLSTCCRNIQARMNSTTARMIQASGDRNRRRSS